jgi:hypothetical protein
MVRFIFETMRRSQYFFRRNQFDAELREEITTHLDMLAKDSDPISAKRQRGISHAGAKLAGKLGAGTGLSRWFAISVMVGVFSSKAQDSR